MRPLLTFLRHIHLTEHFKESSLVTNFARIIGFALALVLTPAAFAQQSSTQAADDFFNHSDWQNAALAYAKVTAAEPQNGLAWQNLGESQLQLHKYADSIAAFQHAVDLKFRPLVNQVNQARAYAEKGDRDAAMSALNQVAATGQGGRARPFIAGATEFARYKDDPEFKKILDAIAPCRSPEYRQFDFWVGDWEVHDPQGNVVGRNVVTLEQDGCLIVEHWTSAGGVQTGTSFNYYDVRDKKWHQLYLDNSGNAGAFPAMAGELKDSRMVLLTNEPSGPISRWTWYTVSPNHVRQMGEQSSDNQKTWQITWDSIYVKK